MKKLFLISSILIGLMSCQNEPLPTDYSLESEIIEPESDPSILERAYPDIEGEFVSIPQGKGSDMTLRQVGSDYIWQGDIILTQEQVVEMFSDAKTNRTAISTLSKHWKKNKVYYKISSNLPNQARVNEAINYWRAQIPYLQFILTAGTGNYIEFVPGSGCSSALGMVGGRQVITLGTNCSSGTVIHEIGHALGLFHEQSRADRDNFISVNYNNIKPNYKSQFDKYTTRGIPGFQIGTFDFESIMLYPSIIENSDFVFNTTISTMSRLDGTTWEAQRTYLSNGDKDIIKVMYGGLYARMEVVDVTPPSGNPDWDNEYRQLDIYVAFYANSNYTSPVNLNVAINFNYSIDRNQLYGNPSPTATTNYSKSLSSGSHKYYVTRYVSEDVRYEYGIIQPGSYRQFLYFTSGLNYID